MRQNDSPNAFSFSDLNNQPLSSLVASSTITVTGFTGALVASVSGGGSPQININGSGIWVTSGAVESGQTIPVRLTTSSSVNTARTATVTVGSTQDN